MKLNSQIIEEVLKGTKPKDYNTQADRWFEFLSSKITFPFDAVVLHTESSGLSFGDIVSVKKIDNLIDMYGLLVEIRKGRKKYIFPICDLEVLDKKSENYLLFDAFLEWWMEHN